MVIFHSYVKLPEGITQVPPQRPSVAIPSGSRHAILSPDASGHDKGVIGESLVNVWVLGDIYIRLY